MKPFILFLLVYKLFTFNILKAQSNQNNNISFVFEGVVTGFEKNTKLYIDYYSDNITKSSDTITLKDNYFIFHGDFPANQIVLEAIIRTEDYSDYRYLYIDNKKIRFIAEKQKFFDADIIGSETHLAEKKYKDLIRLEQSQMDSLSALSFKLPNNDTKEVWDSIFKIKTEIDKIKEMVLKNYTIPFIKNNSKSYYSLLLLNTYHNSFGKETTEDLYYSLPEKFQNHIIGLEIKKYIQLNKEISIGNPFEEIIQKGVDNKFYKLSDLKGKFILLEFWSSNCGPCRKENPKLKELYDKYHGSGFEIYAVSADVSEIMWKKAIEKDKLEWINVSELNGTKNTAFLTYGVNEMPTNYLIDPNGIIIGKNIRKHQLEAKLLEIFKF